VQVFGPVVYMDVQKTASTYITHVLTRALRYPPEESPKHSRMERPKAPSEIAIVSSREPAGAWLSLYNYGCSGEGRIRRRLERQGLADSLYTGTPEGFDSWVRIVGGRGRRSMGVRAFDQIAPKGVGFQSFRELMMSFAYPSRVMEECATPDEVMMAYRDRRIVDYRLRFEFLQQDLVQLLSGPLAAHCRPGVDVADLISASAPINASSRAVRRAEVLEDTVTWITRTEEVSSRIARLWDQAGD
jgi:hypothetical protein